MINLPNGLHEAQQIIIAQREKIAALEKRVKAADELAQECEWRGVGANIGNISALANAYRATGGQDNE